MEQSPFLKSYHGAGTCFLHTPLCSDALFLAHITCTCYFHRSPTVNGAGTVWDQKTSKFFVSHREESTAGHVGVKGVYQRLGKEYTNGSVVGTGRVCWKSVLLFFRCFKSYITYGTGRSRWFPCNNQWVGWGMGVPCQVRAVPKPKHG
jgi:hypothetical protein